MALTKADQERIRNRWQNQNSGSTTTAKGATSAGASLLSDNDRSRIQERWSKRFDVDDTYISTFISDANTFLNQVKAEYGRLESRPAANESSQDYYDSMRKTEDDLSNRAWRIKNFLNTRKGDIDEETYSSMSAFLENFSSSGYSQVFHPNARYAAAYTGKTTSELDDIIAGLDDGEEKDWLTSYRGAVDYEEKSKYDLELGTKEIEEMETVLNEAKRIAMNYGFGGQEADDDLKAQIREVIGRYSNGKYYTINDLEADIAAKRQRLTQAQRIQEGIKLAGVADSTSELYDPEFSEYANYAGEKIPLIPDYKDLVYGIINGDQEAKNGISMATAWRKLSDDEGSRLDAVKYMTADEKSIYNYYYNKHGREAADKYLDSILDSLNAQHGAEIFKALENKPALELVFSAAAGLDQFNSGVKNLFSTEDYIPTSATQYASGMVREDLKDVDLKYYNIKEGQWDDAKIFGNSLGQTMYDSGTTFFNMAPSILVSSLVGTVNPAAGAVVGNTLMGASAAGNAYQEVLNQGYGKAEARAYSTAVGVSESLLQYALGGIGKLGGVSSKLAKAVEGIDNGLLRWSLQYGGKFASEALEEGLQEVLDPVFKNAILHTDEDVNWSEVAYSALLGGLSAGVFEGVPTAVNVASEQALKKKYAGKTDSLIQKGLQNDAGSESYQLAQQYKAKADAGKTLTGAQIRNLLAANQEAITAKDMKKIQQAAEKRFTELGETEDVSKLSEIVSKWATGQDITRAERSFITHSKYGSQVAQEQLLEQRAKMEEPAEYKSLEDRVGAESSFKVSEDGQATDRKTGDGIDLSKAEVAEFVKDKKGKIVDMVIDVDGKQVKASEVSFADGNQSYLFEAVSKIENISPRSATTIIRDYDPTSGQSVSEYLNGIDEAYTYGYHNYSEADMKAGKFAPKLTETQRKSAYVLGHNERSKSDADYDAPAVKMRTAAEAKKTAEEKTAKQKAKIESEDTEVYFRDGKKVVKFDEHTGKYDKKRMAAVNTAKFLSKLGIGGKYYFYESYMKDGVRVYKDANGNEVEAPNGIYMEADGSIHIDLNAGNAGQGTALFTLGHELTHFVKHHSKKQFKILGDLVAEAFDETDISMHERVLEKQKFLESKRGNAVSYAEAHEEVVADAMSTMLSDGSFYDLLMDIRVKDKGLFATIKRFFRDMIAKFTKEYAELTPDQRDAQDIREMKDMFDKIQKAFAEALVEASDNFQATQAQKNTTEDGGVDGEYDIKLSPRMEEAFKPYAKKINSVVNQSISGKGNIDGKAQMKDIMPAGPKITAMVATSSEGTIDISQKSIALSSSEIWHEYKRHTQVTPEVSRGQVAFTRRQFQNAIKCIISPDIVETVFSNANNPTQRQSFAYAKKTAHGNYVVVEAVGGKRSPRIYPVMILQFSKAKWDKMMAQGKTLGEVMYEGDTEMLQALNVEQNKKSRVSAAQFASYEAIANTLRSSQLNTKISQPDAEVKKNSDRDSNGNQLSAEQQEFFKDSKVRDEQGRLLVMYHGTPNGGFTKFRSGTYFTQNAEYADVYQNPGASSISTKKGAEAPMTYEVYLDIKKPFDTRNPKERKIFMEEFYRKYGTGTPLADSGLPDWIDGMDLQEFIEEMEYDYDGLILDEGGVGGYGDEVKSRGFSYVVFSPEQVKDVHNKKPTSNPDIRYSYRGVNKDGIEVYETSEATMNLTWADRVSQYEKMLSTSFVGRTARFKRNGHIYYAQFDPDSAGKVLYGEKGISKAGKKAIIRAGADGDAFDLVENARYDHSAKDAKNHKAKDGFTDYFDYFYKTVQIDGKVFDININVKKQYGSKHGYTYTIKVADNKTMKASPALAGTQPSKVQGTPSATKITQPTSKVNSQNSGTKSERGEDTSNRALLANAFEGLSQSSVEYQMIQDYKEQIKVLNLLEEQLSDLNAEIREIRFTKGKYDAKRLQKLEEKAERIAKDINKQDKVLIRMEASEPLRKVIEYERKKAAQKTKEHIAEIQQNKKARAEQAEYRYKIKNFKKKLEAKLLRPTDRQYVPVDLISAMIDVCNLIDTDTDLYKADGSINKAQVKRDETKEKLQNLKDEYEKLKTNSDPIYAGEFDEMVYTYLTELRDNFSGKSLKEMSLNELAEMYEILRAIDETLADARKLIGWGDAENVYEVGDSIVTEQNTITQKRKNGKRNAAQKGLDKIDNLGLSPVRNVERMSGYNQDSALLKLFKRFEQGIRKKNKFKMEAYKSFEKLTSGKEYDDAIYKEVGGKKYTDIKGRKFGISKMQMMQAILSWEREMANKNLHHIEKGGFTFADIDKLRKGSLKDAVSAEYSHRVPSATEMVAEFKEILKDDKWSQDYMAAARDFFNGKAKDAINETSIALKHRIIARDKNYIPYEVDTNFVNTEITDMDAVQKTINSYGMLKDTKNNAPQALYITGLNNILDRHIEQVGTVYGLAIEVRNFNKVWNVRFKDESGNDTTVKESIDTNWGNEGRKHIEQAVKDIQGPRVRERNALYDKVKSGYIGSTFLLNLSVVTKQIGSLFSATSMLKWRDPARMIGNLVYTMANHKKISAEVDKYTATAWMRRQGMSDAELYTLMTQAKKPGLLRLVNKAPAIINPTKWITAMDHAVALSLWRLAKQDTAKRTGLNGEDLLKATAEFYDEVIENTQSMTDVLHRPEIQKSGNVMYEAFAMFKTDLYQMAGQLQSTAGRYMADKSKENGIALGRTVYSVAMSAIWGQLMTTVFALLRYKVDRYRDDDDEDEKKELTVESWLNRQGFGLVGDLMGYIFPIFGSEVVGIFERIMYGEPDDVVDNIALTAINDLSSAMITVGTSIKDREWPEVTDMRKLAAKALQVFGIPANNILRALDAIQLHAEDIANGEFFSFNAGVDSKADDLYDAIVGGNKAVHVKLKSTYVDKNGNFDKGKYDTAIRTGLKKNDPRIHDAAQARVDGNIAECQRIYHEIKKEGKFDPSAIMDAIYSEESDIRNELEPDKVKSQYDTGTFVDAVLMDEKETAQTMRDDIIATHVANGKTQKEAEKAFESSVKGSIQDVFCVNELDEAEAKNMLVEYAGMEEEEADSMVSYWDFCNENSKYAKDINESKYNKYKEFAEPADISLDVFVQYIEGTRGLKVIKDEWGDVEKDLRDQKIDVIHSLPLTGDQKDALYLAADLAESKIWDVPW